MIELTGKVMVVAIILFFVVVLFFCLHLYGKKYWHRREQTTTTATRRRRRLDFAAGHQEIIVIPRSRVFGLDPRVLKSIPVVTFDPEEFEDGIECAVCLCEVSEGEKVRILPKCSHGFHVGCIDMWFHSHSTCPLCRNPVSYHKQTLDDVVDAAPMAEIPNPANVYPSEASCFPTNVTRFRAFDGDRLSSPIAQASTSSMDGPERMVVIDIPRTMGDDEEERSPVPGKLRSMKRLWSVDRGQS